MTDKNKFEFFINYAFLVLQEELGEQDYTHILRNAIKARDGKVGMGLYIPGRLSGHILCIWSVLTALP